MQQRVIFKISFTSIENVLFTLINLVFQIITPLLQAPEVVVLHWDFVYVKLVYNNLLYSDLTSFNTLTD